MLLTGYGMREWGLILVIGGGLAIGAAMVGWWPVTVVLVLAVLAGLAFFRDPLRRIPAEAGPGEMLSPADGLVSAIDRVPEHPAVDGPAAIVRIYLSVFDVHVNRSPCAAQVLETKHQPGRHLDVRNPASVQENEWVLMSLRRSADGTRLGVRQIAGLVARRIVCPVVEGRRLERAERYGMIKFGSTTELIVPDVAGLEIPVREGQRVYGGLTLLAVVPLAAANDDGPAAGHAPAGPDAPGD
jgi:phosphatidylserine decarboxylase